MALVYKVFARYTGDGEDSPAGFVAASRDGDTVRVLYAGMERGSAYAAALKDAGVPFDGGFEENPPTRFAAGDGNAMTAAVKASWDAFSPPEPPNEVEPA